MRRSNRAGTGGWLQAIRRAAVSGSCASITSSLALALAARAEGSGALQPVNATSHWLNGEAAASVERADLRHTLVGYATHHAATLFWAVLFERFMQRHPDRRGSRLLGEALVVSAVASAVDYGATPKRFTPGWELVLTKRSMAAVYGAMALGLAAGGLLLGDSPRRRASPGRRRTLRA